MDKIKGIVQFGSEAESALPASRGRRRSLSASGHTFYGWTCVFGHTVADLYQLAFPSYWVVASRCWEDCKPAMAGTLNLGEFYIDLLVNMLSLLRSPDVVAALQEILPDTYLLEELDLETLRRIATSPARFSRLIKNHHHRQLTPISYSVLNGPKEEAVSLGMNVRTGVRHFPTLLSGGRFLFLLIEGSVKDTGLGDKACVQLWDLGLLATPSQFTLVASSVLEDNHSSWEVLPDSTRAVYNLVVQTHERIDIYSFDTTNHLDFAKPTYRLAPNGVIIDFLCWKDRIAWVTDQCQVLIWDFKKQLAASWEVDPYFVVDEDRMLLPLVENDVYITPKGCIFQWDIP